MGLNKEQRKKLGVDYLPVHDVHKGGKKKEVAKKMVNHPHGGRMREGSKKARYWKMIDRIGKDAPSGEHQL